MHKRKLRALATAAVCTALATVGLSAFAAQDEESPLHKAMEKVQVENSTILKGVRNEVLFKKNQADIVKAAKELAKIGKETRKYTEPAEATKQPVEKWYELMDKFVKESEDFAEKAEAKGAKQAEVKKAYKSVQTSCTACHDVFRPSEEP